MELRPILRLLSRKVAGNLSGSMVLVPVTFIIELYISALACLSRLDDRNFCVVNYSIRVIVQYQTRMDTECSDVRTQGLLCIYRFRYSSSRANTRHWLAPQHVFHLVRITNTLTLCSIFLFSLVSPRWCVPRQVAAALPFSKAKRGSVGGTLPLRP